MPTTTPRSARLAPRPQARPAGASRIRPAALDRHALLVGGWRDAMTQADIPKDCIEFVVERMTGALSVASPSMDEPSTPRAGQATAAALRNFYQPQLAGWMAHLLDTLVDLWHATQPSAASALTHDKGRSP